MQSKPNKLTQIRWVLSIFSTIHVCVCLVRVPNKSHSTNKNVRLMETYGNRTEIADSIRHRRYDRTESDNGKICANSNCPLWPIKKWETQRFYEQPSGRVCCVRIKRMCVGTIHRIHRLHHIPRCAPVTTQYPTMWTMQYASITQESLGISKWQIDFSTFLLQIHFEHQKKTHENKQ